MDADGWMDAEPMLDGRRLLFVGGLHRSGTTPLAKALSVHPEISGMRGTERPRDEGQHVQSVYKAANVLGGAGTFALRRGSHLDEQAAPVDAGARLSRSWAPYWDLDRRLLLEKSPPNLVRSRFLQAAFPGAAFVMIIRHPIVVSLATRKWSRRSTDHLMRNWIAGHRALAQDAPHVRRLFILSYEDLTSNPRAALGALTSWLGLAPLDEALLPAMHSTNDSYLAEWEANRARPVRGRHLAHVQRRLSPQTESLGYDLREPGPRMSTWRTLAPSATVHGATVHGARLAAS